MGVPLYPICPELLPCPIVSLVCPWVGVLTVLLQHYTFLMLLLLVLLQAVRMKEAGKAEEVVVMSCGPKEAGETIKTALAMGADRGVHVLIEGAAYETLQPLAVAKLFAKVVAAEEADLVILGKQAIDDDSNQTAQMLAGILDWSQATFASEIELSDDATSIKVVRE